MTIEEAKNILINRGFVEVNGDYVFDGDKWRNAIAVISKWLEQQPCEDCISRQAVLALPTSKTKTLSGEIIEEEVNIELIKALPSVVPKEKTVIETLEKIKKEIKQIRIHYGYIDVQGLTIIKVLEIIDKHLAELEGDTDGKDSN